MNGYHFTDRVRKALHLAREEALRLHHPHVGAEHILLGLLDDGPAVAAEMFRSLKIEMHQVRAVVEASVPPGKGRISGADLPYTSRAKEVFERAIIEARALGHSYVGTEHLLLGLLRTEKNPAAAALASFGLTAETARAELLRLVGPGETSLRHVPATDPVARTALVLAIVALASALLALVIAIAR